MLKGPKANTEMPKDCPRVSANGEMAKSGARQLYELFQFCEEYDQRFVHELIRGLYARLRGVDGLCACCALRLAKEHVPPFDCLRKAAAARMGSTRELLCTLKTAMMSVGSESNGANSDLGKTIQYLEALVPEPSRPKM